MAIMIPQYIESYIGYTMGEKKVFNLLQKLPDDNIVYYDISVPTRQKELSKYPDFIIVSPELGLIILEVKDWSITSILKADSEKFELNFGIKNVVLKNPLKQARDYCMTVSNLLQQRNELLQQSRNYKGKLSFSYNYGVVFTNIGTNEFNNMGLGSVINSSQILFSDNPALLNNDSTSLQKYLSRISPTAKYFPPLDKEKIKVIRSTIFPEIILNNNDKLKFMTINQEQVAKTLNYGHQIIHGPVGSGKTTILQSRAVHLAKTHKDWRILVLTFKEWTKEMIKNEINQKLLLENNSNIEIFDVKILLRNILKNTLESEKDYETDREIIQGIDLLRLRGLTFDDKYDAILIDEAQDFKEEFLEFVTKEMLRNSDTSHLLVTVDGVQNIYQRSFKLRWAGLKDEDFESSIQLENNYRNTQQIIEFSNDFLNNPFLECAVSNVKSNINYGISDFKSIREGKEPEIINADNLKDEISKISTKINGFKNWKNDICILCPNLLVLEEIKCYLKDEGLNFSWLSNQGEKVVGNELILGTIEESKGLSFKCVFLCGLFKEYFYVNQIDTVKLIYVGMTRAEEELYILCSEKNIYTNVIKNEHVDLFNKLLNIKRSNYIITFDILGDKPERIIQSFKFEDKSIKNIIFALNEAVFIGHSVRQKMYESISKMNDNEQVKIDNYLVTMVQTPFPGYSKARIESLLFSILS